MRKKILISGRNQMMINIFFQNMSDSFECQTTSSRTEDVECHIKYFKPELFVLCLNTGTREILPEMVDICNAADGHSIPMVLIGDIKECETLTAEMKTAPALMFSRTSRATKIAEDINTFLKEREKLKAAEKIAERAEPAEEEKLSRKHVMVIDDDPRMLRVLKEYLHDTYDVATAPSGKIAMKFLENKHTDLILLDYMMPEENGPEVYKNIRALPGHKNTPIVFLTGVSESKKIKEVMELHPQGYLLKPIEREKFLKSILGFLG